MCLCSVFFCFFVLFSFFFFFLFFFLLFLLLFALIHYHCFRFRTLFRILSIRLVLYHPHTHTYTRTMHTHTITYSLTLCLPLPLPFSLALFVSVKICYLSNLLLLCTVGFLTVLFHSFAIYYTKRSSFMRNGTQLNFIWFDDCDMRAQTLTHTISEANVVG